MGQVATDMRQVATDGSGAAKLPCLHYKEQLIARPRLDKSPPLSALFKKQG